MTFVAAHRDRFGVEPILRVLDIAVSTFYGWVAQQRDPSKRRRDDQALANRIRRIHHRSGQTYGAPRVHAQLRRDGIWVSRKRVARLLRAHGLQGAFLRKRWRCSTRQDPTATPAPDLVNRDFKAERPTGYGWPTSRASRPERGRCGWHVSAMPSPGGSSAGRPAIGPMSSWCWGAGGRRVGPPG
jgi:transposase InsO family protein